MEKSIENNRFYRDCIGCRGSSVTHVEEGLCKTVSVRRLELDCHGVEEVHRGTSASFKPSVLSLVWSSCL